jgi:hypothetical protein
VATFVGLPPITVAAVADQSGFNTGNWTTHYTASVLKGLNVPFFELYHATVSAVPAGASATIGFGPRATWGFTAPGLGGGAEYHLGGAGWLLNPSQEFFFLWSAVASGTPVPLVTAWFRMDIDIPANAATAHRLGAK